jgi:hypothetical protein
MIAPYTQNSSGRDNFDSVGSTVNIGWNFSESAVIGSYCQIETTRVNMLVIFWT